MFPAERFLRAGATFTETGELGALYGRDTTRFDGAADGELRRVIAEHRAVAAVPDVPTDADLPDAGPGNAAPAESEDGDSSRPPDETAMEGKRARNQSRSNHPEA